MQPKRQPSDGAVTAQWTLDQKSIVLQCYNSGDLSSVTLGEYNAYRAFAMLALLLEIDLPKKLQKKIEIGGLRDLNEP